MVKEIIEIEHKIPINKTVKLYSMTHCVRHGYVGACHGSLTTILIHGYTVHCN